METFEVSYRFSQSGHMVEPVAMPLAQSLPPTLAKKSAALPASGQSAMLRLWLLLAALTCIVSAGAHFLIGLNNDHLDLLDQVRRMVAGGTPYVAFSDINPPLIHLIYVLPFMLSKITGLPLGVSLHGLTLLLIGFSLAASRQVLVRSSAPAALRQVLLSAMALALLTASFIHQAYGDRDHLIVVLVSPWLVLYSPLAARDAVSARWRLAIALMAAIGFALKPYAYVLYAASLAYALLAGVPFLQLARQWEHYVIGGFALLYLAVIFVFFPAYPHVVLPVAWHTYGAMQWGWESKQGVIENDFCGYAVTGLAATLALLLTSRAYYTHALTYLLMLLAAAAALYAMQAGWYYTQYPFIAVALVVVVVSGARLLYAAERIPAYGTRIAALACLYGLLAAGLGTYFAQPILSRAYWDIRSSRNRGHPIENIDMQPKARAKVDAHLATHPRFMFFTNDMRAVNLLKNGTPRQNVGRFDYLWSLAGTLELGQSPQKLDTYEQMAEYLTGAVADDLERYQPGMVINDISPFQFKLPERFNAAQWMMRDPRFAKAWAAYKQVDSFDDCTMRRQDNCAYEIYYRQ